MKEITAGYPAIIPFTIYDSYGDAMEDADVTALSYSIYDVTNGAEVRASTAISPVASGTITLSSSDTQLNGSGSREKRRVCLLVNTSEYKDSFVFWVSEDVCDA